MGWGSGSHHFGAVADALIKAGASDEVKTKVCAEVIKSFQGDDWDTYGESLDEYSDDPAIVEAFRQNRVFLEYCENPRPEGKSWEHCRNEKGHEDDHRYRWHTWPNEK